MAQLTVTTAAERLRVSPREVRRLIESGQLAAERFGGAWSIDAAEIARRQRRPHRRGRRWAARTAWAAVELLAGGGAESLLDQPRRSRLRRQLRTHSADDVHALAGARATVRRFSASPRALRVLRAELVLTGASRVATGERAERFGLTAMPDDERVDGYLAGSEEDVVSRLRLVSDAGGPITLRAVKDPLDVNYLWGSDPLIALDLMESDDPREREAGRAVLEELLRGV